MKQKALEQLRSGKSLYGKDGAFAALLKSFLDSALEAELESHLDSEERLSGNRKNGKTSKEVRTSSGTITIDTPRDRSATFEPMEITGYLHTYLINNSNNDLVMRRIIIVFPLIYYLFILTSFMTKSVRRLYCVS